MDEIRSFRDLKCWKEGVTLRQMAKPVVSRFPADEKYRLTDQLIRALRSVTNNIAEGLEDIIIRKTFSFVELAEVLLQKFKTIF